VKDVSLRLKQCGRAGAAGCISLHHQQCEFPGSISFHPQQHGFAGCLSLHHKQFDVQDLSLCTISTMDLKDVSLRHKQCGHAGCIFSPQAVWTCRSSRMYQFAPPRRVDFPDVSLSTPGSMDLQDVSLCTTNSLTCRNYLFAP
jgi:hypothetical protein